jgi:hypothetical protein
VSFTWSISFVQCGVEKETYVTILGVLLRVPQSIVFSVRFLCIAGYCLASSLLFSAFVSIELRILCAVVHTEGTDTWKLIFDLVNFKNSDKCFMVRLFFCS